MVTDKRSSLTLTRSEAFDLSIAALSRAEHIEKLLRDKAPHVQGNEKQLRETVNALRDLDKRLTNLYMHL